MAFSARLVLRDRVRNGKPDPLEAQVDHAIKPAVVIHRPAMLVRAGVYRIGK